MDILKGAMETSTNPSDPKAAVMEQVRQESAVNNARELLQNINEHCFERCITKPASSLSKGEQTCMTQCMEKYIGAWNTIRRQYINRIQREQGTPSMPSGQ